MENPLIKIEDWSGGNTLNQRVGRSNQSFRSFGLEGIVKRGALKPSRGYVEVTGFDPNELITDIMTDSEAGDTYFAQKKDIYKLNSPTTAGLDNSSGQPGDIKGLREYKGFMYYPQSSSIGRLDLNSGVYTDNWNAINNTSVSSPEHPMEISADNFLYFGAGQTLDRYDGATYVTNVLDLQDNWRIFCLANFGIPYLAIGANFNGPGGSVRCKIFLWDRISPTWNDEIEIPENKIFTMYSYKGGLWILAGSGDLSLYYVPLGSKTAIRVFTFENNIPNLFQYRVPVNAICVKSGRIFFGYSGSLGNSRSAIPAVYSFNPDPANLQLQGEFLPVGVDENLTNISITMGCVRTTAIDEGTIMASLKYDSSPDVYMVVREQDDQTLPFISVMGIQNLQTLNFDAPPGKKLYFDGFGIDAKPRPSGKIILEYRKDDDTTWTQIYQTNANDTLGFYKKYKLEAFTVAFRISIISNSGRIPWPISRFYGTGHLIADAR